MLFRSRKYSYLGSRENGGFAEFVRVPVSNIIELPQNVSYEEAAMLEPLSVAVHAMRSAKPRQEDTVAVFGVGTIGLLLCMILKEMGIEKILVIGNKRFQLENVLKLGLKEDNYCDCNSQDINQWIMQRTNQQGVDISFECVGKGITINQAIESTTPSGKIQLIGNPESDITLFKEIYWKILRNQLTVMGSWNSSFLHNELDDWHYALGLLEQNRINLKDMITHRFGYDDLKKGLEIMRDKIEEYIKVLIIFDSK